VPFTTGILLGIGEDWRDRAESLLAIREIHERHGHVQEVIVQNVVPNERSDFEKPDLATMRRVVAMARAALPRSVGPSAAEPLARGRPRRLRDRRPRRRLPVTDDYVNPDYAWPDLDGLRTVADAGGMPLRERLPTYARFLPDGLRPSDTEPAAPPAGRDAWIPPAVRDRMRADDPHGRRLRGVARGDGPLAVRGD